MPKRKISYYKIRENVKKFMEIGDPDVSNNEHIDELNSPRPIPSKNYSNDQSIYPEPTWQEVSTESDSDSSFAHLNEIDENIGCNDTKYSQYDGTEKSLKSKLVDWYLKHNPTLSSLKDLLEIISPFDEFLPKDPRTLLGTRSTPTIKWLMVNLYI